MAKDAYFANKKTRMDLILLSCTIEIKERDIISARDIKYFTQDHPAGNLIELCYEARYLY